MADIYAGADADTLVTGEAVALDIPAASVWARALGGLIDVLLQFGLLFVGLVGAAAIAPDETLGGALMVLTVVICFVGVPVLSETLSRGRTLGKVALGLRAVRDDGGPVSFHHCLIRALVGVFEIWALSGVPALVTAMVSPRGKRVGDYAAGTYVVRERFALQLPAPVGMPPALLGWAQSADIAALPDQLALAVRQVLARLPTLSPAARQQLLDDLSTQVSAFVAPPPPPGTPPDAFLAAVIAERRRRDAARLGREADLRARLTRRRPH